MKKTSIAGFLFSVILLHPIFTAASTPTITTGRFSDSQSTMYPLLGISTDGDKWIYPSSFVAGRPYTEKADFFSTANAACSRFFCTAVGQYSMDHQFKPWLATSKDGLSWSYIPVLPAQFVRGELDQVKCSASLCVAVGFGATQDGNDLPVLINSSNGTSWSSPVIGNVPQELTSFGLLSAVTCDDNGCIAAGRFEKNKKGYPYYPLVAISTDKGNSWRYSSDILSKTPAVSSYSDYYDFSLANITCNETTCVIGGTYSNSKEGRLPLLAVSNDKGATWNYPKSIFSNMPGGAHQGELNKVACDQKACVAVGKSNSPLLAVSDDRGVTWRYPASITDNLPSDYASEGELQDVSCNNHVCVAVGNYKSKNPYAYVQPLLAVSYDHGNKWSYVTRVAAPSSIYMLHNVACNDESCMITGTYYTSWFYPVSKPLLLTSKDNGMSWGSPLSAVTSLPGNLSFGEITSID